MLHGTAARPELSWHWPVKGSRWCTSQVLAKLYIDKGFERETRNVALFMLHNLRASFKADLLAKTWLTDATKKVALEKLHNMFAQVCTLGRSRSLRCPQLPAVRFIIVSTAVL